MALSAEDFQSIRGMIEERVGELRVSRENWEAIRQDQREFRLAMTRLAEAQEKREEGLRALQQAVGELAQAQTRTEKRGGELVEAQARTEKRLEELAQAQTRTEQWVAELAEAQARTEKRLEELAQAHARTEQQVAELAEAQARTEKRLEELAQAQARTEQRVAELAEAQARTEKRLEELAQAHARTEQRVAELAEAQKKTESNVAELQKTVRDLAEAMQRGFERVDRTIGALTNRLGAEMEDTASIVLADVLLREKGWEVEELERVELRWNGKPVEIDAFGEARDPARPDEKIWIVAEAKINLARKDLARFVRRLEAARRNLSGTVFGACFCYRAHPEVRARAKELGIPIVFSTGRVQWPA